MRRRKAASRFEELEKEVNEVRNNSLDYKFNKAKAFSKANADIMERVNELSPRFVLKVWMTVILYVNAQTITLMGIVPKKRCVQWMN